MFGHRIVLKADETGDADHAASFAGPARASCAIAGASPTFRFTIAGDAV